jgi:acetolactate synthase-1/2/3 large subunit
VNGSEAVVRTLQNLDVSVVFGLCGDTTLPLYEALHDIDHGIVHVLTRDERSASYMADAYARLSGKVGVCEGPSGGGATYILPGVAEANGSSVPLVCLTSDIEQSDYGRGTLTELDQCELFRAVTRWTHMSSTARELPRAIDKAFRIASSGRMGATHIGLPYDVQVGDADSVSLARTAFGSTYPRFRTEPALDDVRRAAKILADAKRPLLIAGAGVVRSGAWDEMTALAHALGAPVATSICGKGSIAETDPYALGVIGSNGGLPYRHDVLRESDVLFYVGGAQGSVSTEKWTLPRNGEKTVLHLDVDPERIGLNYDTEVGLLGDAKRGLDMLLWELEKTVSGDSACKVDPEALAQSRSAYLERVQEFGSNETPIRPERFVSELSDALAEESVVLADPGTGCPYLSAYHRLPRAGRWFVSPRAHGALGYALPGVVGAYSARPDAARIVGVMGDGSFGISCGELETIARLDLPVTLIVLNNSSYGWIKAGQKVRGGKYFSVDFSDSDHAAIGRAFGLSAKRVENPTDLRSSIDEALSCRGPFLLDVVVQPLEEARAPVSKWIA